MGSDMTDGVSLYCSAARQNIVKAPRPQHCSSKASPTTESEKADALPSTPFSDEDWRERIARAKQAREDGRKARQGKPLTFRTRYDIV